MTTNTIISPHLAARLQQQPRQQWSSLFSYLLVTTGMVVGLGNIFKLPYCIAKYGSLFIVCYIGFELLISIPIFIAEAMLGRRGKQNPVGAISIISMQEGANLKWRLIGWLCAVILFLTLTYYSVEASFSLAYVAHGLTSILHLDFSSVTASSHAANTANNITTVATLANSITTSHMLFVLAFLVAVFIVIAKGLYNGLEKISRLAVPFFFLTFLGLAVYSCIVGDVKAAINYLFDFNLHNLTFDMVFIAFIYAFFKLNVGTGTMIVYGSYLPLTASLGSSTLLVALFDDLASLLAYFVIYPIALKNNAAATAVTNLNYQAIPNIFANIPHGSIVALLFFLATIVVAWMPGIAMAESITAIISERLKIGRRKACLMIAVVASAIAFVFMLSYGQWANVFILGDWTIRNTIQDLAANILTPLSALLITLFVGWIMKKEILFGELGFKKMVFYIWYILIRYVAPTLCASLLIINIVRAVF